MSTWLPSFLKIYILGYGPLIFFLIATTLFIIELRRKKTVILVDRPIPVPVSPLPQFLPIQQKKFYSERNKSDLANAFTDLLELLNRDGFKIIQKVQKIIEQWRPPGIIDIIGRKEPDIAVEIDKLNEIGNLAATLYRDLFEENGFLSKYNAYHDELCQILQIRDKPSTTSNQPLIELQSGINFFINMLTPINLAEKYNDKNLITWMMTNTSSAFGDFQHKVNLFRTWIDNMKRNITAFRNSHL